MVKQTLKNIQDAELAVAELKVQIIAHEQILDFIVDMLARRAMTQFMTEEYLYQRHNELSVEYKDLRSKLRAAESFLEVKRSETLFVN